MESKGGVAAVDRAFLIIQAFNHQKPVMTLAEIARATGLYKSTILRLLGSLEKSRFIVQRADGTYQLGPALLELASVYQESFDLRQFVQPVLEKLVADTNEGASFFVLESDYQLCLFRVDGRQTIRDYNIRVGDRRPLDEGAAAEAFRRFGNLPREVQLDEMAITSFGNVNPDMAAIAAPVFGRGAQLLGVMTLSGPITRFTEEYVAQLSVLLVREVRDLSLVLGMRPGLIRAS
ncbi:MAG: IclR family transcriptional regulator [Sphingomonadales bacterium]|nr:IclR family transcriptional regulator [Sphingomonadales bacterium]MBD3772612.1 IclR family transcriptional regulator [Paracoccaceae bacterium]